MIDDPTGGILTGAIVGVGGLAGALMYVRRALSRDATEIRSDRAERAQISRFETEMNRLREDAASAKLHAEEARLDQITQAVEIASLTHENRRLLRDIKRAVRSLPDDVRDVLETDFSALADVDERIEPRR